MPVVKLNQSRPHSPPVLSDKKRTLGINHIHTKKSPLSVHTSTYSPTPTLLALCSRIPCLLQKAHISPLCPKAAQTQAEVGWEQQPAACLSSGWVQQNSAAETRRQGL